MSSVCSRKATSHSYSTDAARLDNNLDALLEDLQTSVSPTRSNYSSHYGSTRRDYHSTSSTDIIRKSPLRATSPLRSISPMRQISPLRSLSPSSNGVHTTVEKYVTTGPAGSASGIPGLEMLDAELQDVQPGQSKTVAYKQVSYHYDKSQEGKKLEPWSTSETIKTSSSSTKNDACILDGILDKSYEDSRSHVRHLRERSPADFGKTSTSKSSSSANKEIIYKADVTTKTIPAPQPQVETTSASTRDHKIYKETFIRTHPSPLAARKNLNTVRHDESKAVSTNVEYIPSVPPSLAPGPNTKVTTTVKTYTYELPGAPENYVSSTSTLKKGDKSIKLSTYSLPRTDSQRSVRTYHHQHEEQKRSGIREYSTVVPATKNYHHKDDKKVFVEEHRVYRAVTPPPQTVRASSETRVIRNEQYIQSSNDYIPTMTTTTTRSVDHVDHSANRGEKTIYVYERPAPSPVNETTRTTVKRYEEHISGNRPPKPVYPTSTTESSAMHNKSVYKYTEQSPPRRLEDLMASFSETEEHLQVIDMPAPKKETMVEREIKVTSESPALVKSNQSGPPVYYPPGSAEFTRKEVVYGARSGQGYEKEKASWEYGTSSKSKQKEKQKKAVVPVCLPLCCALPCVIM